MKGASDRNTAMQLLELMFQVELDFLNSDKTDAEALARAFHPDVVVHEPASLPYSGDWRGLTGIVLRVMSQVWSDVAVEDLAAAQSEDLVFMTWLRLTSRARGARHGRDPKGDRIGAGSFRFLRGHRRYSISPRLQ
ncbi:nuclear transport factor 2 family protein [Rhizobium etli]|uniref:SnoaL-like protein n=1 Tax=Rhizobium etli TaxID=29449 RepID=A0A7W6Y7A4_RHIET|nr:nuclear transport factor 2 family protein [Rhizobium etli]MBB4477848.1 hypothetical protein [Rhizobium etli]MBB4533680.1 hypothetical protein [Rhizobium etli]